MRHRSAVDRHRDLSQRSGSARQRLPDRGLDELQSIVERGPDWNALDKIEIRPNPRRRNYDITLEGAEAAFAFNASTIAKALIAKGLDGSPSGCAGMGCAASATASTTPGRRWDTAILAAHCLC
jgi:hypothetical protein